MAKKEVGPPRQPPNPALPYREDCWSEGATSTLIDAWGERYLELNRGNLRQKQWQEVADAVNSRRTAVKRPKRTDVQCKNRIDTLKKKYKVEKTRMLQSKGVVESQWPFFSRLDMLIGSSAASAPAKKRSLSPPPLALPLPYSKNRPLPPAATIAVPSTRPKQPAMEHALLRKGSYSVAAAAAAAAAAAEDDEVDSESENSSSGRYGKRGWRGRERKEGDSEVDGVRELAQAIVKFAQIYEKVESAKQRQMMELEKQRMEFAKGVEFQRMQMFVDSQVQLAKIKRSKSDTTASGASE